jgi:hypothetical protein
VEILLAIIATDNKISNNITKREITTKLTEKKVWKPSTNPESKIDSFNRRKPLIKPRFNLLSPAKKYMRKNTKAKSSINCLSERFMADDTIVIVKQSINNE